MSKEPRITINGYELTEKQAQALRVACDMFLSQARQQRLAPLTEQVVAEVRAVRIYMAETSEGKKT